jgi:hypothetical protein
MGIVRDGEVFLPDGTMQRMEGDLRVNYPVAGRLAERETS